MYNLSRSTKNTSVITSLLSLLIVDTHATDHYFACINITEEPWIHANILTSIDDLVPIIQHSIHILNQVYRAMSTVRWHITWIIPLPILIESPTKRSIPMGTSITKRSTRWLPLLSLCICNFERKCRSKNRSSYLENSIKKDRYEEIVGDNVQQRFERQSSLPKIGEDRNPVVRAKG
jgi:hypothetical protein